MKNTNIARAREHARIYQQHYRPSLNFFRLLKSILGVFISGTSPAGTFARRK